MSLLTVDQISVDFPTPTGIVHAVRAASFELGLGEMLGIVGETGAGKSALLAAIGQVLKRPGRVADGKAELDGVELTSAGDAQLRRLHGKDIGFVFQNPKSALNPLLTVGRQMVRLQRAHFGISKRSAWQQGHSMLASVGLPNPDRVLRAYPHQLSGGMAQRVMIAMALINSPKLVLADEPTTGLDVTVQVQVLDLFRSLIQERSCAALIVTHDLTVVSNYCDQVIIMRRGEIIESGPTDRVFDNPAHPYTRALVQAVSLVAD